MAETTLRLNNVLLFDGWDFDTRRRRSLSLASALSASEDSQIRRAVRFSGHGSGSFCDRLA